MIIYWLIHLGMDTYESENEAHLALQGSELEEKGVVWALVELAGEGSELRVDI